MKSQTAYFHCGNQLRETLAAEIQEVLDAVAAVE